MIGEHPPTLAEALNGYVTTLKSPERQEGQQELNRFIQWCGRDRLVIVLTPPDMEGYAESISGLVGDPAKRLKPVKSFLVFLKDKGFINVSLAPHLRVPKSKGKGRRLYIKASKEQAALSAEGMANLRSRLDSLKKDRIEVVEDIRRAMADKDFKENSPLDAAKERQGMIESSIREIEKTLANAVVLDGTKKMGQGVKPGKKVTLKDLGTGKKVSYTLVHPREADPLSGKISSISPVGKALLDKTTGDEVRISVPKGAVHYVIEKVED